MIETETAAGDAFLKRLAELKAAGRVVLRMECGKRNGTYEFVHDDSTRYEKPIIESQPEMFPGTLL